MADLAINRPISSDNVTLNALGRIIIAEGNVFAYPFAVGVGGRLVQAGTHHAVASGTLLSYFRSGPELKFWWTLLFDLQDIHAVRDGVYDMIITTYRNDLTGASDAILDEVRVAHDLNLVTTHSAPAAKSPKGKNGSVHITLITITQPTPPVHKESFTASGYFSNGDLPTMIRLTNTTTGDVYTKAPYCFGTMNGYWYAGFSNITAGKYTIEALNSSVAATPVNIVVI